MNLIIFFIVTVLTLNENIEVRWIAPPIARVPDRSGARARDRIGAFSDFKKPITEKDVKLSYGDFHVTMFPNMYGNNFTEAVEQVK